MIDANAILNEKGNSFKFGDETYYHESIIQNAPTVETVPWEFLGRYADWFCASVSLPEFVRKAKAFYESSVAAMDGFTIADGERR